MDDNKILEALVNIQNNVIKLNGSVDNIGQDVTDMKQDMTDMKQDMTDMKQDITDLKHRMINVEEHVKKIEIKLEHDLKEDIGALFDGWVDEIRHRESNEKTNKIVENLVMRVDNLEIVYKKAFA